MLVVLVVLVFFVFRNNRKRKAQTEELQSKMVPGARVMTSFGLYGTVQSIDDAAATAELEIAPGTVITVHKQTLAKVVSSEPTVAGEPRSVEEAMEIANREAAEREAAEQAALSRASLSDVEPEFGERIETENKPAGRTAKKPVTDEDSAS
jgi:preprotein translocase subunit YajC